VSVKPNLSYHLVETGAGGLVTGIKEFTQFGIRINSGFFVLKRDIFRYIRAGEELVIEPFQRLIGINNWPRMNTTVFSLPWTRLKTSNGSTISMKAGNRPGKFGGRPTGDPTSQRLIDWRLCLIGWRLLSASVALRGPGTVLGKELDLCCSVAAFGYGASLSTK
jgi:hypothetical protein